MSWWVKVIGFLIRPFPRWFLRLLGKPLGFLWFDVLRIRRDVVMDNLAKAFPDWTEAQRLYVGRRSVYMLMENFFEFFMIPRIDDNWIRENVVVHGEENLKKALEKKKGILILCLHLNNGDLMGNCLSRMGYNVYVITKFFKNQFLNKVWFGVRGAQGLKWIPPHGEKTPFMILKALKAGAMVGFVLDQHMGRPFGIRTTFFGRPAGTASGLALFHLKTKAPVVPMYNYSGTDGKIHIVIESSMDYDSGVEVEERDAVIARLTQNYVDCVEKIIRRHPEQWMWVHRRWKWKGP